MPITFALSKCGDRTHHFNLTNSLYFSKAAYLKKVTPRPNCRNPISGTSAMRER